MSSLTAHCLVKNEENFVGYAIKSVIDFVDKIIVFDTGSADKTVEIIAELTKQYPGKIIFEEKGECDKERHTQLRNEMIAMTETDWFMILDGDEVWTKRAMTEATNVIENKPEIACIMAPFYLCVGDIYHKYYKENSFNVMGKSGYTNRFVKNYGVKWKGQYGKDTIYNLNGEIFFNEKNTFFINNKFWHLTHLNRSPRPDFVYSSGGDRSRKERLTYFVIGRKINDDIPEVFGYGDVLRVSFIQSLISFFSILFNKFIEKK